MTATIQEELQAQRDLSVEKDPAMFWRDNDGVKSKVLIQVHNCMAETKGSIDIRLKSKEDL